MIKLTRVPEYVSPTDPTGQTKERNKAAVGSTISLTQEVDPGTADFPGPYEYTFLKNFSQVVQKGPSKTLVHKVGPKGSYFLTCRITDSQGDTEQGSVWSVDAI
jgi:hypothetical protein